MRELERDSTSDTPACSQLAIVGRGRLGTALAGALSDAHAGALSDAHAGALSEARGYRVTGPLGRGAAPGDADVVLLCVPDGEIAGAAALIPAGPAVGHCSGATGLDALAGHTDAFSLHPLMTVTASGARFAGAGAAIAGSSPRARRIAADLAAALEMQPFDLSDADRTAYHAAASIASNFLITLEAAAERIAATAGVERSMLVPLVRATVENWAMLGPERALTGPVARGDQVTVDAQREAIAERTPDLLPLFDALVDATEALASRANAQFLPHSGTNCAPAGVAA